MWLTSHDFRTQASLCHDISFQSPTSQRVNFKFSDGDRHRSSLCHQDTSPLFPPIQNHVYPAMPNKIVRLVIAGCNIWPDGAAGVSEGVMPLLGGSMMLHPTTPRSSH